MAEVQAGITALVTAYARAYHATHDSPIIFDDRLADQYYTAEEHTRFNQNLATMLPAINPALAATNPDMETALACVMQTMHEPVTISRSRYTEDCLEKALRQGVGQYVILGAGLDTFAFRRPELAGRLTVFEVDHPVTQAMKQTRIDMAGWTRPAHLHFVPLDFASQSLAVALEGAGFDRQKQTLFSWLGVTYYLTREVIWETLRTVASLAPAGGTVVFDYMDETAFDPERAAKRTQLMHMTARRVGEPMKSGFDPARLAEDLKQTGLRLAETLSPVDIQARYFEGRSDRLRAFEHVHFARAIG